MSRAELDRIQSKLKGAIQAHQILVGQLKTSPQNVNVQRQLKDLQVQITTLSGQQRSIVQELRQHLISKQKSEIKQGKLRDERQSEGEKTMKLLKLGRKPSHNSVNPSPPKRLSPLVVRCGSPTPRAREPLTAQQPSIRVPQYSIQNRPSILQGRHGSMYSPSKSSHASVAESMMPSPSENVVAKATNSDIVKRRVQQHQIPPLEKQKLEYMAMLDLVTLDTLKELQNKKSERRRRSTANPQFKYCSYDPQDRRPRPLPSVTVLPGVKRGRGRPPKSPGSSRPESPAVGPALLREYTENDGHDDFCAVCHRSGELLMCDTCSLVYHLGCLDPPLARIPRGDWSCPQCVRRHKTKMAANFSIGNKSFSEVKSMREAEHTVLGKRKLDMDAQLIELESKSKQLKTTAEHQAQQKSDLLLATKNTQKSVDKLKGFINIFQTT